MTCYEKFDCQKFELLFIAAVGPSDDDYDGFYVAATIVDGIFISRLVGTDVLSFHVKRAPEILTVHAKISLSSILTGLIAGFLMVIGKYLFAGSPQNIRFFFQLIPAFQHMIEIGNRQSHHIIIIAVNLLYKYGKPSLNSVGSRFIHNSSNDR